MADNCFPGYELVKGEDRKWHNMYMGTDLSVGGYVYADKDMYLTSKDNPMGLAAITFDAASLHPTDAINLNAFGDYTERFANLLKARLAIKHKDYETVKKIFGDDLGKYLTNKDDAKGLSNALKTALNSIYGISYASFPNAARDPRNVNNIIALRGSLIMRTLQERVAEMGYRVIHIKTDSIKVANPDKRVCDYILEFGKHYGITYEVEHTWDRLCLVNDAVFVGRHAADDPESPLEWETTGTQFQIPFIRKSLFTHEEIDFYDICKTISVQKGELHLVYNADTPNEDDIFVGRVGLFVPMKTKGASLYAVRDGKRSYASGSKGYLWMEAETVKAMQLEDDIDYSYWRVQCDKAVDTINKFGDFEEFVTVD